MQKKIRTWPKQKMPFMSIAGDEDVGAGTVSFRYRDGSQRNGVPLDQAAEEIVATIRARANAGPSAALFAEAAAAEPGAGAGTAVEHAAAGDAVAERAAVERVAAGAGASGRDGAGVTGAAGGPELTGQDGVGEPDALERLWTPHRMAYIKGEGKPGRRTTTARSAGPRRCPTRTG